MTDGQTDGHVAVAKTALCIARVKKTRVSVAAVYAVDSLSIIMRRRFENSVDPSVLDFRAFCPKISAMRDGIFTPNSKFLRASIFDLWTQTGLTDGRRAPFHAT